MLSHIRIIPQTHTCGIVFQFTRVLSVRVTLHHELLNQRTSLRLSESPTGCHIPNLPSDWKSIQIHSSFWVLWECMNAGSGMRKHDGLHLYCNETGWITFLSPFPKAQLSSWKCVRINSVKFAPQQLNIRSLLALLLRGNTLFSLLIVSLYRTTQGECGYLWLNKSLLLFSLTNWLHTVDHTLSGLSKQTL